MKTTKPISIIGFDLASAPCKTTVFIKTKRCIEASGLERGLIVRQPHIGKILDGIKTAEMRSRHTAIRGRIGLIEQGTGLVVGECNIYATINSLTLDALMTEYWRLRHRIEDERELKKWTTPWLISDVKRYSSPFPYIHPKGAVTWVKLNGDLPQSELLTLPY